MSDIERGWRRDIYEVANQLAGYVGPDTPDRLAKFLLRESEDKNKDDGHLGPVVRGTPPKKFLWYSTPPYTTMSSQDESAFLKSVGLTDEEIADIMEF